MMKPTPQLKICSYSFFFWGKIFATWLCGNKGVIPSSDKNHQLVWILCRLVSCKVIEKPQENNLIQHWFGRKIHNLAFFPQYKIPRAGMGSHGAGKPDITSCQSSTASQSQQRFHKSSSFTIQFRNISTPIGNSDNFQSVLIHSSAQMWKEIWRKVPGEKEKKQSALHARLYLYEKTMLKESNLAVDTKLPHFNTSKLKINRF